MFHKPLGSGHVWFLLSPLLPLWFDLFFDSSVNLDEPARVGPKSQVCSSLSWQGDGSIMEPSRAGVLKLIKTLQRAESELRLNLFMKKDWFPVGGTSMPATFSKELFILLKTMATDTACIISHWALTVSPLTALTISAPQGGFSPHHSCLVFSKQSLEPDKRGKTVGLILQWNPKPKKIM